VSLERTLQSLAPRDEAKARRLQHLRPQHPPTDSSGIPHLSVILISTRHPNSPQYQFPFESVFYCSALKMKPVVSAFNAWSWYAYITLPSSFIPLPSRPLPAYQTRHLPLSGIPFPPSIPPPSLPQVLH
jgi:hypothetical protein